MLYFAGDTARDRILKVLQKYNLPTSHTIPAETIRALTAHDKKASGDVVTVVKVDEIGSFIFEKVNIQDIAL